MSISTSMKLWWMENFSLSPKFKKLLGAILFSCVFCQLSNSFFVFNLWFTSLLNSFRKQRLYYGWQWASEYSILNPSMRCLKEASPFPAQSPLVLVSYLFHKQKKISKLGWAAIWQSVCLKLIFNTRTKNIRYVQTEKPVVSCILTQLYTGMLQLLVCPFTSIPYSVHNKH